MSPRRRVDAEQPDIFGPPPVPDSGSAPAQSRRRSLPVLAALAGVLIAAMIGLSTYMLVQHETDRRAALREASALGYVEGFMTAFTSLDPFNANDYAERILEQGTGDFATMFQQRMNEIVIQVAQAEPTTGEVLETGVQRWHGDGSADVLVAVTTSASSPDGETTIESGSRWVATVVEEGQQWKISQLIPVI